MIKEQIRKSRCFERGHFIVFYRLEGCFSIKWSQFGHKILSEYWNQEIVI